MHEVSLVQDLVDAAAERSAGVPVGVVRVRHASTVPEEALRQAWLLLTDDRPGLRDARLDTETFDVRMHCGCGFSGALGHDDVISATIAVCPSCGEVGNVPRTAELELLEVRPRLAQPPSGSVATSSDAQPPVTLMS